MNEEWDDKSDKNEKNKKTKPYRSTKKKIKKFIPKEKDLSNITTLNNRGNQGIKIIDTADIKEQNLYVSRIRGNYYQLRNKLDRYKKELRLIKRTLPSSIRYIERLPKEIEELKKALKQRNALLRKEEESTGYLIRTKTEFLEKARRKMEEDNIKEEERIKIEKRIFLDYDLESLKKSIELLEMRIEIDFETLEDSKDSKIINSHEIEELEEIIQELKPKVKMLKDKLDKETSKLIAERSTNLMRLFDKKERENNLTD